MNRQNQFDKKGQLKQQQNDDDEQIEKTLNFFDSILDQYLTDQDIIDENNIQKSSPQVKSTNGISLQQNGNASNHTNTSSSSSTSHRYTPPPQFRHRSEQPSRIRRYTSETDLNQIPSSSKSKISHSRPRRTTATSTDDFSATPSQTRRSNFTKKSKHLSSNNASASLIDLSSIDKLSSRPRFRFVPPSNENHTIKEEPEIEEQFHLKTISSNQTSFNNQTKPFHKIVKPTVIVASVPKSAPINRLTETDIHHQNGNSAFKPHRSSKNGVASKIQQIKRTESIHKPNLNLGITNSDNVFLLHQQQQSLPQYHQSTLNQSSPEPIYTNRSGPPISYQSKQVQSNKLNGYHSSRPIIYEDPISRWIQQVNNTSSINGLVYPENPSQQYGHYISKTTSISSPMNNHRQSTYSNLMNNHKYHSPQRPPNPVQSFSLSSPLVTRNGVLPPSSSSNVYNFNQNNSPRDGQSKRNLRHQNLTITTYL